MQLVPRDFKKDGDYAKNNFTYLWAAKHEKEEVEAEAQKTFPQNLEQTTTDCRTDCVERVIAITVSKLF